jgi:hypothetical protein
MNDLPADLLKSHPSEPQRPFQFQIRTLLAVMTVAAVAAAYWPWSWNAERQLALVPISIIAVAQMALPVWLIYRFRTDDRSSGRGLFLALLSWAVLVVSILLPLRDDPRGGALFGFLGFLIVVVDPAKYWHACLLLTANVPVLISLLLLLPAKGRRRTAAILFPVNLFGLLIALTGLFVERKFVGVAYFGWLLSLALMVLATFRIWRGAAVSESSTPLTRMSLAAASVVVIILGLIGYEEWQSKRKPQALLTAVRQGDVAAADLALRAGVDPEITETWGWHKSPGSNPMNMAASRGDDAMVNLLLSHGADVNRLDGGGTSPLLSATRSRKLTTVRLLLRHGANPRSGSSYDGSSPLHAAAGTNDTQLLAELLHAGIPVDVQDRHRRTPLHAAASAGKPKAVQFLLEHGSDRYRKDHHGHTALDNAQHRIISAIDNYNAYVYKHDKKQGRQGTRRSSNSLPANTLENAVPDIDLDSYEQVCRLLKQT